MDAREAETQIMQKLQLDDAYIHVHSDCPDMQDPQEGYTFGFGVRDEDLSETEDEDYERPIAPMNLYRIYRIHVTPASETACPLHIRPSWQGPTIKRYMLPTTHMCWMTYCPGSGVMKNF